MTVKFQRKRTLPLAAQAMGLRRHYPNGQIMLERNSLRWCGELSPGEYSRIYSLEMLYRIGSPPSVWVRKPNLRELAKRRPLPHVYDANEQKLCLYVPNAGIWRPDRALAFTILPWAGYWLRLFEMWLVTDVWHERGVHPGG